MNAEELLAEVEGLGVTIQADGDVLRLRPGSCIPPELVDELRSHKAELMELVSLRGWPAESQECVRRFRTPEARLYPFLNRTVATPQGRGRLLQVFADRAAVVLARDPRRVAYLLPSEVRPPGVAGDPGEAFEAVH